MSTSTTKPACGDSDRVVLLDEDSSAKSELCKQEGNKLYGAKQFSAAIAKYTEAMSLSGDSDVLLSNRAACHLMMREFDQAAADTICAIKLNPSNLKAYYRLASAYSGLGEHESALDAAKQGLAVAGVSEEDAPATSSSSSSSSSAAPSAADALQIASLRKLAHTLRVEVRRVHMRRRKEMLFGGDNLTACLDCSTTPGAAAAGCQDECCINNFGGFMGMPGAGLGGAVPVGGKKKVKTGKSKAGKDGVVGSAAALPPAPPGTSAPPATTGGAPLPPAPPPAATSATAAASTDTYTYTPSEYAMLDEVNLLAKRIREGALEHHRAVTGGNGSGGSGSAGPSEVYSTNLRNLVSGTDKFQDVLFPGASASVRRQLPKSLKELYHWNMETGEVLPAGALKGAKGRKQDAQMLLGEATCRDDLYPRIAKSAASVFDALQAKAKAAAASAGGARAAGAGAGPMGMNMMDIVSEGPTKRLISQQVLQEAFARELILHTHAQNRRVSGKKAKSMLKLAVVPTNLTPGPGAGPTEVAQLQRYAQIAESDALNKATISRLHYHHVTCNLLCTALVAQSAAARASASAGADASARNDGSAAALSAAASVETGAARVVSVQDGYLGEDWAGLLREDLQRYVSEEQMTVVGEGGVGAAAATVGGKDCFSKKRMCWVDRSSGSGTGTDVSVTYPALTELLTGLQALPYEINRKTGCEMELLEPTRGTTLLVYTPVERAEQKSPDGSGGTVRCIESGLGAHGSVDTSAFRLDNSSVVDFMQLARKDPVAAGAALATASGAATAGSASASVEDTGFRVSCVYLIEDIAESEEEDDQGAGECTGGCGSTLVCQDVMVGAAGSKVGTRNSSSSSSTEKSGLCRIAVKDDRLVVLPTARVQHDMWAEARAVSAGIMPHEADMADAKAGNGDSAGAHSDSDQGGRVRGHFQVWYYVHGRK